MRIDVTECSFSYKIVCNWILLHKFLRSLYKTILSEKSKSISNNKNLDELIRKEVGTEKVWREEVNKLNNLSQKFPSFSPCVLDLLSQLIMIPTEKKKPIFYPSPYYN